MKFFLEWVIIDSARDCLSIGEHEVERRYTITEVSSLRTIWKALVAWAHYVLLADERKKAHNLKYSLAGRFSRGGCLNETISDVSMVGAITQTPACYAKRILVH